MFGFHTTQANERVSASTRKSKNFHPCACAYACVELLYVLMLELVLASLMKTRLKGVIQYRGCAVEAPGYNR